MKRLFVVLVVALAALPSGRATAGIFERLEIARLTAMTPEERLVFWSALEIEEQRVYYWYALDTAEQRVALCQSLGLADDCVPLVNP